MFGIPPFEDFVANGRRQIEVFPSSGSYYAGRAARDLCSLRGRLSNLEYLALGFLLAPDPMSMLELDAGFVSPTAAEFRFTRTWRTRGTSSRLCIGVSAGTGLPTHLLWLTWDGTAWQTMIGAKLGEWVLEPAFGPDTFATHPPPGMHRICLQPRWWPFGPMGPDQG
jgi:hypothetical protein